MRTTPIWLSLALLAGCPSPEPEDDAGPGRDAEPPDRDGGADAGAGAPDGGDAGAPDAGDEPAPCGTARVRDDLGIPTIDGFELFAFVDRPDADDCRLPTILIQTPYGAEGAWRAFLTDDRSERPLFDSPFYNYVVVDWRGRFGSSDLPHGGEGPWLAQDSFDTVEWVADQPWSDGVVGTWGVSALCGAQYRTASGPRPTTAMPEFDDAPPPALRAMVPIMCGIRATYTQVYPGGVLRHEWVGALDVLGFGLRAIYESNPRRNVLWNLAEGGTPSDRMAAPALVVGGFWDIAPQTTVEAFRELVRDSDPGVRDQHRLLIGPWIHFAVGGATTEGALRPLTEEERGFMDLERRIDRDSLAFFDHHLRGRDRGVEAWAPVRYHHANVGWREAEDWPPPAPTRTLHLTAGGGLEDAAPPASTVSFDHDPADPSPTLGGSTLSAYNCLTSDRPLVCTLTPDPDDVLLHGPTSQAPLLARDDQLFFQTAALAEPLTLLGAIRVHVEVSTTARDTDVAVRLVDVDEAGDPLLIGEGIARVSARDSDTEWSEVVPGTPYAIEARLQSDLAYDVPAGHRLGLIVSATNWPLFARNPGDGAVFLRGDTASGTPARLLGDAVAATNTLHLGANTRIEIGE